MCIQLYLAITHHYIVWPCNVKRSFTSLRIKENSVELLFTPCLFGNSIVL